MEKAATDMAEASGGVVDAHAVEGAKVVIRGVEQKRQERKSASVWLEKQLWDATTCSATRKEHTRRPAAVNRMVLVSGSTSNRST